MAEQIVHLNNLGNEFDIGTIESNKIHINFDGVTINRDPTTGLVTAAVQDPVSEDAGNIVVSGADGGAFLDVEAIQDAVGQAIAAGVGITYDDAMNAIGSAFAGLTGGTTDSIVVTLDPTTNAITADAVLDTSAANLITVSPTGIMVDSASVIATVEGVFDAVHNEATPAIDVTVGSVTKSVATEEVQDVFGVKLGYFVA